MLPPQYGGSQVSRQKFEVNTAESTKSTSICIFHLLLKFLASKQSCFEIDENRILAGVTKKKL